MRSTVEMLIDAKRALDQANWQMRHDWHLPASLYCDEVALLFGSQNELNTFVADATTGTGGILLENFNSVPSDVMVRQDTAQQFLVRFEFLRELGGLEPVDKRKAQPKPWRIEAMCVLGGAAPLHEAHLARNGNGSVVHVSYKLPTVADYEAALVDLADDSCHRPAKLLASYRNSYGMFSYFNTQDARYLKPRVNTRD